MSLLEELRRRRHEAETADKRLESFVITADEAKRLVPQFVSLSRDIIGERARTEQQIFQLIVNGECRLFGIPVVVMGLTSSLRTPG